ncbi:GNAT family N-acetyltransferase [Micromonospora tulbaghiae]|uniref:GNAT family N-acetyltransferase n=1 Tax=Micromonospora tulbaghiae TaxID=479978 RepID=A0A386WRA8_9ACTN|nr:GNAT family N-acetyltransferase [Micromonospora tulbaghiae]AYF30442.1 GNAT family N-acetyltransferase [Micromonospora tulbaghiae]
MDTRIRVARWADITPIAALAAEALHPAPLGKWLVPDPALRRQVLADVLVIWVEHAMFFGDVQVTDDLTAAAIAFHRYRPIPPPANYPTRLADAAGGHADRFATLDTLLAEKQPTEPHYHLALFAVAPAYQRTGRGTALLAHHRSRLDRIDLPSWTTIPAAGEPLLTRYGYTPRPQITLPDGPTLCPMRRNPTPASDVWPTNTTRTADNRWQNQHA